MLGAYRRAHRLSDLSSIVAARVPVATARGWRDEQRFLVFGVFLAGDGIAGVYTRAGARITGREAVFLPLVLGSE